LAGKLARCFHPVFAGRHDFIPIRQRHRRCAKRMQNAKRAVARNAEETIRHTKIPLLKRLREGFAMRCDVIFLQITKKIDCFHLIRVAFC
jgi:hypothetical protein